MKTISFISGRRHVSYIFLLVFYICATNALAYNSMPLSATSNKSLCAFVPSWQLQQQTVTGTVTYNNMPLTGVTITVNGKNTTTISGEDGKFSIAANGTDTLIFEYLGFKTQTVAINNKTNLTVQLEDEVNDLKEVTVNAGYYTVKETERTGSISRITSKDIERQPVTNVLAAMQGRMPGVNITQNSGVPGGSFDIQIRGQNSLRDGGNSPLYIIDGVPYASESIGSTNTSGITPRQTSPLNSINPGDIESIEVLKDADATAIYGSRGANGVILLTTKRGRAGKTVFSANISGGFGEVTRFIDLMDTPQYLAMRRQGYANDGITEYPEDAYDVNGTWDQSRNTNWQKELIGRTATFNSVQASVSGGSETTQFLLSGNFNKETTVFPGDFRYFKNNVHFNGAHQSVDKKFKISLTGSYTAQDNRLPASDLMFDALVLAPNAPALYDADGNLNWENNTFNNPLANLNANFGAKTYDLVANSLWSYKLPFGFEARASFGYTDLRHRETRSTPSSVYNPAYGIGSESSSIAVNETGRKSWIIEPQLDWNYATGKLKLGALAGSTFQQQDGRVQVTRGIGFASNSLIGNPASAGNFRVLRSEETVYKYQAVFGRVNLSYGNRYIINATARRDGSSRFGPAKRFATFGAVGAAWLFSNETWVGNHLGFLSFGKLRGSYGTSGNDQIGDYQYLDTYSTSGMAYQGSSGLQPSRLFNPDFGWETNRKLEAALELGFLNDRIFITTALYRNRSSDQLVGIPLAGTTGFSSLTANLGAEVQNSGFEESLRTVNIKTKNFSWTTNINLTIAKNKLLSFPGLEGSSYKNQFVIGQPVNIIKMYHYTGLDPQTGVYTFEDANGDGQVAAGEDRTVIKNLAPKYFGGIQNQLRYGAVSLDFLFQFVKQQNFNPVFSSLLPGTMANQPAAVAGHWQQPGDNGPYQLYSSGLNADAQRANTLYAQSDAAITDASYVRLKNIALSFDLPQRWTKKFSCRLGIQGQNMLTFTKYKGADPEFGTAGFLPPLKVYTTSLQFTF